MQKPRPCSSPASRKSYRRKLLLSTLILSAISGTAYAGSCLEGPAGTFTCSGIAAPGSDSLQDLTGSPLTVTTVAGFGIETSADNAFTLTGTGGLSFTDNYQSNIVGTEKGIEGYNFGSGTLSITTTGLVVGLNGNGINAYNEGTDLIIHVADVSGGDGIIANQAGTGALSITATGSVMGSSNGAYGILASNSANATDLTVQANNVTGGTYGIYAQQSGNGVASITATGLVMSTIQSGLYAQNDSSAGMVI
ncbi:hypothetical protein C9426_28295, partial [Serratia sp. S1B]